MSAYLTPAPTTQAANATRLISAHIGIFYAEKLNENAKFLCPTFVD